MQYQEHLDSLHIDINANFVSKKSTYFTLHYYQYQENVSGVGNVILCTNIRGVQTSD